MIFSFLVLTNLFQCYVHHEPVHPGRKGSRRLVFVKIVVNFYKALLEEIFCFFSVRRITKANPIQFGAIATVKQLLCVPFSIVACLDQFLFSQLQRFYDKLMQFTKERLQMKAIESGDLGILGIIDRRRAHMDIKDKNTWNVPNFQQIT